MAINVPYIEPVSARAGDTWSWKKQLSDYPASTWTLTYVLFNSSSKITFNATSDGDDYSISIVPAITENYVVGRYDWIAQVSDGTDRHQVGAGVIQVLPDVETLAVYDGRTHNRRMLDSLKALMEKRADNNQIDVINTTHNARSLQRDPAQLMKLIQQYGAAVRAENDAQKLSRGENTSRLLQVKFR